MREYQRHNDAVARRIAQHFGRSDLPGQLDLPQTESRLGDLAKRKVAEPLKPDQPQKPMDIGLFSDDADQLDLIEMFNNGEIK